MKPFKVNKMTEDYRDKKQDVEKESNPHDNGDVYDIRMFDRELIKEVVVVFFISYD